MGDRLRGVLLRLRRRIWRGDADRDLDEELRFHLEMATEAGVAEGLDPEEARRRALVRFGGVERHREASRDLRGGWVEDLGRDLRLALRQLRSQPVFAVAAIGTLALGIGANTAIFSVVDAVLLADSPFPDPDRLVVVWETDRSSSNVHEPASWPDVVDFRLRSRSLESIGALVGQDLTLIHSAGEPERVTAIMATPNLFTVLGVRPLLGRLFSPEAGGDGADEVVLGEEFWRSRFRSDSAIVGRTVTIQERPATVVGVVPASADLGIRQVHRRADYAPSFSGADVQVWAAMRPTAESFPRDTHPFLVLARLDPDASVEVAQEELAAIASDLERLYPVNADRGVHLERYSDVVFGPVRPALLVLLGAVGLVLLITCANVANLLLARTRARLREVAVRRALGAAGGRIRQQFLVEGLVLAVLGAAAGVAVAHFGLRALLAIAPADIPRLQSAAVDGRVLVYTAALASAVALIFGLLPSLRTGRLNLQQSLRSQGRSGAAAGGGPTPLRGALVVAEVALAVLLVIGAGLLLRSLWALQSVDPGFRTEGVIKAEYQLPDSRYPRDFDRWPDIPEITSFHATLLAEVQSLPGVESAAIAGGHPIDPGFTNSFQIVGREEESASFPEIRTRFLSPGYLETLEVELIEGRAIRPGDDVRSTPVVLLNRSAAERYFPDGSAVGSAIRFWGTERRVVGIIADERFRGVDEPSEPAAYAPLAQNPQQRATLLFRTAGDPMALVPAVRRRFRSLDPQLALYDVEPLRATLSQSISRPRFLATLLTMFGGLSLLLALIGVHGVLNYAVAERNHEVGVRMALGASRQSVVASVVGRGLALAALGTALGAAAALAGAQLLGSLLFGITTRDPTTFIAVPALVLAVGAAAALAPAWKAARADPAGALRTD